jgi:hypothetical protein
MVFLLRGAIKPEEKGAAREEDGAAIVAIRHDEEQRSSVMCLWY